MVKVKQYHIEEGPSAAEVYGPCQGPYYCKVRREIETIGLATLEKKFAHSPEEKERVRLLKQRLLWQERNRRMKERTAARKKTRREQGKNNMEKLKKTASCKWKYDEEYWYYDTACQQTYQFVDGGLAENDFVFCPFCGEKIIATKEGRSRTSKGEGGKP